MYTYFVKVKVSVFGIVVNRPSSAAIRSAAWGAVKKERQKSTQNTHTTEHGQLLKVLRCDWRLAVGREMAVIYVLCITFELCK